MEQKALSSGSGLLNLAQSVKPVLPRGRCVVQVALFLFSVLLSLNSWSASAKRSPTPNFIPSGICSFKSKSFVLPNTDIRIYQVEVFTSHRGTGCLKGQTHSFWNKCDIRENETSEGTEPIVEVMLKFRDSNTLLDAGYDIIPMADILELGWITDRKGNPRSITETSKRENVNIKGTNFHIVAKRNIKKLDENKISTEVLFYLPADTKRNLKSKLVYQVRCESEFTNKNY